jgi:outer membrane protein OmpA-like peptidoglycan-associated protein
MYLFVSKEKAFCDEVRVKRAHQRAGSIALFHVIEVRIEVRIKFRIEVRRKWHMSSYSHNSCRRVAAMHLAVVAILCSVTTLTAAQDQPTRKWELFGGYSFVYFGTDVHGLLPGGIIPVNSRVESNPRGAGASITYNFNRWLGLTGDVSGDLGSGESGVEMRIDDAEFFNFSAGPKFTFRRRRFSPFLEALVGEHRLASELFRSDYEVGFIAGGGLDLKLNRHFALRLIRADYVYSNHQYGSSTVVPGTDIRGARLQSGLVFTWGGKRTVTPPSAVCSLQPAEVFAGEPVTATADGSNFNPKRTVAYSWSGSGVKAGETRASTQIDTTALQAGAYEITASLSDGSQNGVASCSARFTVKMSHPPVISCSSDPASVPMGGTSTITSTASSPDGRLLSYNYTSSAGNISGNSSTATLNTAGAEPGTIMVTCSVSDDRTLPLTASASTTVYLQAPPPPPPLPDFVAIEKRLALHSVYFATAKPTPENPDAGLLASQEKTLTALARDFLTYLQAKPDARLTLEGHADPRGSVEYNQSLSERRVDRVKRFLVEQGVPDANIQTKAFGEQKNLTDRQVRDAVERNPELSPEDRQRVLSNMRVIILASNRRVDITLSNFGQAAQESVREYPFNAADSLTLLQEEQTKKTTAPAVRKKRKPKAQ